MISIPPRFVVLLGFLAGLPGCDPGHQVEAVSFSDRPLGEELRHLDRLIADARIVLLGENGHGVREFTEAKVDLIEWLHGEHGFDVVVFESGLFECDSAWRRIAELSAAQALKQCLRFPFEHAEILPLFEYMKASASTETPLAFSGMDFQAQGYDSEMRAREIHDRLRVVDPGLARRVASADTALFLMTEHGGLGDGAHELAFLQGDSLRAEYRHAAEVTSGVDRLTFRLAQGWIDRLAIRGKAESEGLEELPGRYYELRDEWLARAVASLADSVGAERKVAVWLHNDHARYGRFPSASDSIRSTGGYLRDWFGPAVVSVGFFLGRGEIADNARRPRTVAPMPTGGLEAYLARAPATYLVLRSNSDAEVREWAAKEQPYLRMGLDTMTLTPTREFDALVFIDSVSAPSYDVR